MEEGREVVENYGPHGADAPPCLAFLRDGLAAKGVMICASAPNVRDIFIPDLRLGSGIKMPTRDFR